MPTPKLFKRFSPKNTSSGSGSTLGVPADDEKTVIPRAIAVTADSPVPEIPQAQRVEKPLNEIGMCIMFKHSLAATVDVQFLSSADF
jgi:hypothetical protein